MGTSADSIRVVGEADLLDLAGCARSTWQNWCRKELLEEAAGGLYGEADVIEAAVVRLLVSTLDLRRAQAVWRTARGRVIDACLSLSLEDDATLDAVVDLHTWDLRLGRSAEELHSLCRTGASLTPGHAVVPLASAVRDTRHAFWIRATPAGELARDKRRKSSATRSRDRA